MWQRLTSRKVDMAEAPAWSLGVMDFLEKVLSGRDTYHHPNEGQFLTLQYDICLLCG